MLRCGPSIDPEGLWAYPVRSADISVHISSTRPGRVGTADQGDLRDARAVWLSARTRSAALGRLGDQCQEDLSSLQGVGHAVAQ